MGRDVWGHLCHTDSVQEGIYFTNVIIDFFSNLKLCWSWLVCCYPLGLSSAQSKALAFNIYNKRKSYSQKGKTLPWISKDFPSPLPQCFLSLDAGVFCRCMEWDWIFFFFLLFRAFCSSLHLLQREDWWGFPKDLTWQKNSIRSHLGFPELVEACPCMSGSWG